MRVGMRWSDFSDEIHTCFTDSLFCQCEYRNSVNRNLNIIGLSALDYFILLGGIILMFAVSLYGEKGGHVRVLLHKHYIIGSVCIFLLLLVVLLMGSYGIGYNASNFIYNQF